MGRLSITTRLGDHLREHCLEVATPSAETARAESGHFQAVIDGTAAEIDWVEIAPDCFSIILAGRSYDVSLANPGEQPSPREPRSLVTVRARQYEVEIQDPRARRAARFVAGAEGPLDVVTPMPGKIVKLLVSEGDEVDSGQGLIVIEAMKMQNELRAPRAGCVQKIYLSEGWGVEAGAKLLRLA